MRDHPDDAAGHEQLLEAALCHLLGGEPHLLTETCEQDSLPVLHDIHGEPVEVSDVRRYHEAGLLTASRGVVVDLSDGVRLGLTITRQRA